MKLTKNEQKLLLKNYNSRWTNEIVEFIDDEFMWVIPTIDNSSPEIFPLLGHVCVKDKLDHWSVRFYHKHFDSLHKGEQLDNEFRCICDPCPFPKYLKLRVTLLHKREL